MFIKLIKLNIYFPDYKEQVSEKATCMQHFSPRVSRVE